MSNHELKALNESAEANRVSYLFNNPSFYVLESFPNPSTCFLLAERNSSETTDTDLKIEIIAPEFTCLCPITGQPDFGTIRIIYKPLEKCVESKSLKLYLMRFRDEGMFHEAICCQIRDHLVELLHPSFLKVVGEFAPRGGIAFNPSAEYYL